jgi:hypothetical protein
MVPAELIDQPYEYFDNPQSKIGAGPIEWAQPDWYKSKFLSLTLWSPDDLPRLVAHFCGTSPYMYSFDLYRVAWESIRQPDLEICQTLMGLRKSVTWWQAPKAINSIATRSENMGVEVTQAIEEFTLNDSFNVFEFEQACRKKFEKHVANRVNAVRSLLVGSGNAVETHSEDGSIFLRSPSLQDALDNNGPQQLALELRNLDANRVRIYSTPKRPISKHEHGSQPVPFRHFEVQSGTSHWEVTDDYLRVVGSYEPPARSKAFGLTSLVDGGLKYSFAGTASQLYAEPSSDLRFLVTSRSLTLFGNGEVFFSYDPGTISHNSYLNYSAGALLDVREKSVRLVLGDGRILRMTKDSLVVEAIQLSKSLCNSLIESSCHPVPSGIVRANTSPQVRRDVLAGMPIRKRKEGFFRSDIASPTKLSVRDILNLTPEQINNMVANSAKARELQIDALEQIKTAFDPYFGSQETWPHSKIAAEFNLLRQMGWKIPPNFYSERPKFEMRVSNTGGPRRYTPVKNIRSDEFDETYLELAGEIRMYKGSVDELIELVAPDNSSKLQVFGPDRSNDEGPSTYVDFDDYAYSVAEIALMRQYSLVLADAVQKVNLEN